MRQMKTILLILSICCSFQAVAQSFGARLATNIATIDWKYLGESIGFDADYESKVGLDIAGVAVLPITDEIEIQGELHFIQKGGKDSEEKVRINYIELQLPGRYNIPVDGDVIPFVLFGPHIGFLVGGETDFGGGSFDSDEAFKGLDAGLSIGAGIDFLIQDLPAFIDIRYHLGIANTYEFDDWEARNRAFNIGLGLWFAGERAE